MSFRNNLIATSALTLVSLCGASSLVNAAETQTRAGETCAQETRVGITHAGHPGKSSMSPKREVRKVSRCASAVRKPLVLASFTDARGGPALVRGETELALEQIHALKFGSNTVSVLTNQCVALTVMREWTKAGEACDAAVDRALKNRTRASYSLAAPRVLADTAVAVAYSNRAVMHWLSSDATAAHADLDNARKFGPGEAYVMRNLEVTERGIALARATDDQAPIG
jgi:RecA-family ATPase